MGKYDHAIAEITALREADERAAKASMPASREAESMPFIVVVAADDNEPCAVPVDNIACIQRLTDPVGRTTTHIYLRHVAGARPGILFYVATHESPSDLAARIEVLCQT